MRQSQVAWALKHGIRSVVTIKETPLNADWFSIEGCGLNYRHLKVEDYGAPPLPELDDIVNYIDNEINKNDRPVIVHCNGGSGRTGTILAAYFMKKEKLTAEQALAKVNEIRGRAPRHRKQIDTLKEYQNYLTSSKQHY
jgi:atypical dual specificity phosphatase